MHKKQIFENDGMPQEGERLNSGKKTGREPHTILTVSLRGSIISDAVFKKGGERNARVLCAASVLFASRLKPAAVSL